MRKLALLALALAACGGGDGGATDTLPGAEVVEDVLPDVSGEVVQDVAEDAGDDAVADVLEDVAEDTAPGVVRRLVQEATGLGKEPVFKGVWAGEAGRVVAVGNDGIIVARDPDGSWRTVSEGSASELLNDVTGVSSDDLWAVGKGGALLRGGPGGFYVGGGCASAADCDDGDPCTLDACVAGSCQRTSTGGAGCCGTVVGSYGFDDGTMQGWAVQEKLGTLTWQPFSWVDPVEGPRFTSPPSALYFGDPSKPQPNFDGGTTVAATAVSPPIVLPKSGSATLSFQVFVETESSASYDQLTVSVATPADTVEVWSKTELPQIPTLGMVPVEVDLAPWIGQPVTLRVRFDSVDSGGNLGEGVFLDDVRVITSCEGAAEGTGLPTLWGAHAVASDEAYAVGLGGTIARWDGQRWQQEAGPGTAIDWYGLHGTDDTLALVGSGGAIRLVGGDAPVAVQSPTTADLRGVHTADGTLWWAVGDAGTVVRGEGGAWTLAPVGTSADLHAVHGRSAMDAYAVGNAGAILHWDGSFWTVVGGLPATVATTSFRGVWVAPDGTATITGAEGALLEGTATAGFQHLGNLAKGGQLNAVWGQGATRLMVGDSSALFRYDGAWGQDDAPSTQNLRGVWGSSPASAWAVGLGGLILGFDGVNWTKTESPTGSGLEAVWVRSPADAWAAGAGGVILHFDGDAWSLVASSTPNNLRAVHGRPGDVTWAVGAGGTIMRRTDVAWSVAEIAPIEYSDGSQGLVTQQLHGVWAVADDDAWAVGEAGQIVHWDGETWTSRDPGLGITLRGVYALAADDVWAVGNEGHALHFDGQQWSEVETGSVATLHDIHGDGQGQVVVVGDIGTVLRLVEEPAP